MAGKLKIKLSEKQKEHKYLTYIEKRVGTSKNYDYQIKYRMLS